MSEDRYEGDFNDNGERHGHGILIKANGSRYEGEFKDGVPNGRGVCNYSQGTRYEGEWVDGESEGKGIVHKADGTRLEGEFKDGVLIGHGIANYSDGDRYEGEWEDGNWNGQGIANYSDGVRYEGKFVNGAFDGNGVQINPDGSRYEGEFKGGCWDGNGVWIIPDGSRYEGEFKNDKPHGKGIIYYADGRRNEGHWHEAELQWGMDYEADGSLSRENFVEDTPPENIENMRREVSNAFDKMMKEEITGFIAKIEPYYVQFVKPNAAIWGKEGRIIMEAVHNVHLDEDHQIDGEQEGALREMGFTVKEDDMGPINWETWARLDESLDQWLIGVAVRVLSEVFEADPDGLEIKFV